MPDRKILTLKANQGQDEANFGGERYPVNLTTHTVDVPEDAAAGLLKVGGFELETAPAPITPGFIRLIDKAGDGCSWGGQTYEPDADGFVTVPVVAAADLAAHGYVTAAPKPVPSDETPSPDEDAPTDETEPTA
jgi:hypothetical protein